MEKVLNNIKVISDSRFKFVTMRVSFLSELDYQDIAAYNLLVKLLTTRNTNYPSIDLFNSYLESNYGMVFRGTYFNRGNVGIFNLISTCMNSKYSLDEDLLIKQIDFIKDCLFKPFINETTLNEVKSIYIQKLKEQLNKKTYILKKKVNTLLGNDNPYGVNIESDIESIEAVTLEKINKVYNKLINSDVYVYVCGDVEENRIKSLWRDERLKNQNNKPLNLSYIHPVVKREPNVFESHFLQSAISLIYECDILYNHELYYALKVFLEMFNYDLFNIIREQYNFCYYIYAISNNYLNTIEIVSEIESTNLDKIISLIDEILVQYQENFNYTQFEICKNKIFAYIKNSLDSAGDIIDLNFGFDFTGSVSSIEQLEEQYKKVTANDVKKVAQMLSLKIVSILKEEANNE